MLTTGKLNCCKRSNEWCGGENTSLHRLIKIRGSNTTLESGGTATTTIDAYRHLCFG